MFKLADFAKMINDSVRMQAYAEALRRTVRPESVVVDIGAGTGIFSLLACQYGARRVYAIDPNPWLQLGRLLAEANGFADRIVFLPRLSTNVALPEKADIIVSELRGRHPFVSFNVPTLNDARRRFLKPDGLLIPQRDVISVSLLSAPALYEKQVVAPWAANDFNLDMRAALRFSHSSINSLKARDMLQPFLPPQVWGAFDYSKDDDPNASAHLEWIASEAATAHYIMIWFDSFLFEDIHFTSAPIAGRASLYDWDLLPLEQPLNIAPLDKITLEVSAALVQGDYVFTWNTTLYDSSEQVKAAYQQSTFYGRLTPFSAPPASRLNPEGKIALMILNALNNNIAPDALAARLYVQFPDQFKTPSAALAQITAVSERYVTTG